MSRIRSQVAPDRGARSARGIAARTAAQSAVVAVVAVVGALSLAACSKDGDIAGIRNWQLGKTVRADFKGHCSKWSESMASCVDQRPVDLGGQAGLIELYFPGDEPDAPLSEILISVRACRPDTLSSWLTHKLGKPAQEAPRRAYWKNGHAFIAAQLPAEGVECLVSFVSPKDEKRIAELKAGGSGDGASVE